MATIVRVYNDTTHYAGTDEGIDVTVFQRIVLQAVCLSVCVWCILWGLRLMRAQYVAPAVPGKLFKRHLWLQHRLQQRNRPGGDSYT